jgi:HD superfamily phosphodiesterase
MKFEKELINKMEAVFGDDGKRIEHALNVTQYAKLLLNEEAGNMEAVFRLQSFMT